MAEGRPADGDAALRAQYEDYPYPPRDPADERRRLIVGSPGHRLEIDHYCFGGGRDWTAPFRALIAGGGTGDALIMLAQQLKDSGTPCELTYLDLSRTSRAVAEDRARIRGLDRIRFVTGSLLDLAELAPGPYDYVDCCGVLHHLADPVAGLKALAAQLAPGGGMGLMLYGALGRTGVYPLQDVLRALGEGLPPTGQVALARRVLKSLPSTNWFLKNPFVGDHKRAGDAALYDLLLHSQDRAYIVPEVAALLDAAGLAPTGFIEPIRYDPAVYLSDTELAKRAQALPWLERAALAENLCGSLKTHVFYAVPKDRAAHARAEPDQATMIPLPRETEPRALAAFCARGEVRADFDGVKVRLSLPENAAAMAGLMDGRRNLADIHRALGLDWFAFKPRFDRLYAVLNGLNLLLLRSAQPTSRM